MDILTRINDGERCLDSEYNEEWDDWYNSDVDEVLFSDSEHLLPDIEEGIHLLHRCLDHEEYGLGCELAELLSALKISAEGDYNDYDGSPLGIGTLYQHELLHGSFERVVRESLFLTYVGNELTDRADELFCMMGNYQCFEDYGESASYIAALGEVKESRGETNAKARIMEKCRAEYSRRSAFHGELRAYGMRK